MRKRIVSLVLALLMVLTLAPSLGTQANAQTGGHTRSEAVNWAISQQGVSLDFDNVYGETSVDLIKYYYKYLGENASYAMGNANAYAWNDLPPGWTRVTSDYRPGDIAVFKTNYKDYNDNGVYILGTGDLGHVSIITSMDGAWFTSMNQSYAGHPYVEQKSFHTACIDCAIRPDFIANKLPDDFYGYLIQMSPWHHTTVNGDNLELCARNGSVPKQIFHYMKQSDGYFKIVNEYNGAVLGLYNGNTASGTNVGVYADNGSNAQRWKIYDTGNGVFELLPKANENVALDVNGGATDVGGTNLQVWNRSGGAAQRFSPYIITQDGVTYEKPAKPSASAVMTTEATAGVETEITWNPSPLVNQWDERSYSLTVKDSSGAVVLEEAGLTATSFTFTFPASGTYTAQVTAVNTMYQDYQTVGSETGITVQTTCEAVGHQTELRNARPATCTQPGYTGEPVCTVCGEIIAPGEVIPALGHSWDEGVVTQEPTETADGVKTFTCERCGETRTESIPKPEPVDPNPFVDVAKGKFYYDPILWAISQDPQITTGVTNTTFEPDRICTRAHVVTFLWRANGCPNPQSMTSKFKDVKDTSKYYYKAVLWANEQGITTGYSDGTFRPDDECSRGQVVTFLWRAKGSPAPTGVTNPFSDVPAGKYYTNAILWALKNNITQGRTATTFGPDDACTRGHVVTFLYRAYAD